MTGWYYNNPERRTVIVVEMRKIRFGINGKKLFEFEKKKFCLLIFVIV